jgi:hypothetical protein
MQVCYLQQTDAAVLSTVTEPVLVVLGYADGRVTNVIARLRTLRKQSGSPVVVVQSRSGCLLFAAKSRNCAATS